MPNAQSIPPPTASMTREEYNAQPGLSYSGIKELLRSPAHYQLHLKAEREETKALRIGSAVHMGFLLPDKFTASYAQAPECDRRTKDGKALYQHALDSLKPGQTLLPSDEYEEVIRLVDAANALVDGGLRRANAWAETPLFGRGNSTPLKGIPDLITQDGWIYDLKTCEDASPQGFLQAVRKYRYNLQAYFYRHAVESAFKCRVLGFRFIAVEKEPPYATAVYELGPELMTNAAFDFERVLSLYKQCTASGEWPGYQKEITTIDLAAKPSAATNISFA